MLGHLGLQVNRLIRVAFGPFELGELRDGAIAEIETAALREQLGEAIAAEAGCDFISPIVEREAPARSRQQRREERRTPRGAGQMARRARTRALPPRSGGELGRAPAARPLAFRGRERVSARTRPGATSRFAGPVRRATTARKSRRDGRAAAMPGARTMRRCGGPIAARAATISRSPTKRGPTSAPASSRTARAAASWWSGSAPRSPSLTKAGQKPKHAKRPAPARHRTPRPPPRDRAGGPRPSRPRTRPDRDR